MSKRGGWALFLAAATLFLILNRAAYKGYFQADDLDTLGWARTTPVSAFLVGLVSPRFSPTNFRPTGYFYYRVMSATFGFDFSKYPVPLHALHLLNIWLVWLVVRKLKLGPLAASAGAFFFGFHAVLFDAWWKPMYVFDVLCTTFCLLSLLLYFNDRWLLSLLAFWVAYKSKELAIALPAVLVCYELLLGEKRWKRLIPFFAVSLLFGVPAFFNQPSLDRSYRFQLHLAGLAATISFYSSQLFFVPFAGLALVALAAVIRDRRLWFGLAAMCLFLIPLFLLPTRVFAVYWYLPLTGAAVALATLANGRYCVAVAVFLALWIPWDFVHFRAQRRLNEKLERRNREYVAEIWNFAGRDPGQRLFVYDGFPEGFLRWGVTGALICAYRTKDVKLQYIDDPGSPEFIYNGDAVWLHWDRRMLRLYIVRYPRTSGS